MGLVAWIKMNDWLIDWWEEIRGSLMTVGLRCSWVGELSPTVTVENCSLPFTFNGRLYEQCVQTVEDINGPCDKFACILPGRLWAYCLPPTGAPHSRLLTYLLTYLLTTSLLITDHFGGPGRSVGPVCVCLSYVWTKTFERFDLWPGYLECWFILTCPVRAPGRRCALVHLLISVLYRLFVCSLNFLTSFLTYLLPYLPTSLRIGP